MNNTWLQSHNSEVETEGSGVQGLAHLYNKFKVSLGNKRSCFKTLGSREESRQETNKGAFGCSSAVQLLLSMQEILSLISCKTKEKEEGKGRKRKGGKGRQHVCLTLALGLPQYFDRKTGAYCT